MKSRLITKVSALLLLIIISITMLSGCSKEDIKNGNDDSENIDFRGIPFGTKYSEAIELIEKDLEEQGYVMDKNEQADAYYNERWLVLYKNVKLYDYVAQIHLRFEIPSENKDEKIPVSDDNKENSVLTHASYTIESNDLNKCFQYFYDKLEEKYGKEYSSQQWLQRDSACLIMNTGKYISISYEMIDWEKVNQNQSKNRGL